MPRRQLQRVPQAVHGAGQVLLRLCQPQRKVPIGIIRRRSDHGARARDRFLPLAALHKRENQVVRGCLERRPLAERGLVRLDRGVEGANPFERFTESILDVRIARRQSTRFPEQRQCRRVIALSLEHDGPRVGLPRAIGGIELGSHDPLGHA